MAVSIDSPLTFQSRPVLVQRHLVFRNFISFRGFLRSLSLSDFGRRMVGISQTQHSITVDEIAGIVVCIDPCALRDAGLPFTGLINL